MGQTPLPVVTVVTEDQSVTCLSMVFIKLKSDLGRYFGSETLKPVMIVMDGSIVLLKTMLLLLGYSEITPSKD